MPAAPSWLRRMQSETIHNAATRLVVVSGMSGSGKTIALRTLEDLDYYCVDNLPSALMEAFVAAVTQAQPGLHPRLAVGIDVRNRVGTAWASSKPISPRERGRGEGAK